MPASQRRRASPPGQAAAIRKINSGQSALREQMRSTADTFEFDASNSIIQKTLLVLSLNPAKDAESLAYQLVLDPGRSLTGTVVGPDGKPLAGTLTRGLDGGGFWTYQPAKTAEFTVSALKPGEPRRLTFLHKEKRLAGTLLVRGDEKSPLTVKLEPWGVLTGLLVDGEGRPQPNVQIISLDGEIITPEGTKPRPLDAGSLLYPGRPDKDRVLVAISGDTTQGVLWGLKNGEGQGFQPKAIMLMIGTNNSGGTNNAGTATVSSTPL